MNLATYWRWLNSTTKKSSTSPQQHSSSNVHARKKKFQLVQNPSVVAFSVHNLVVVAVLAHMTSLQSFGVNGLACASSTRECNKRKVGLGHNTLVEREREVSCSAVKIWHTRQLPPLQIGLMRVGFQRERDYCSSSQAYMQWQIFSVEILGGNWRERVSVSEPEKRDENTITWNKIE